MEAIKAKWHHLPFKKHDESVEELLEGPELVVVVMGVTGCGKSSANPFPDPAAQTKTDRGQLINLLTGRDSVAVGDTLKSKVKSVEAVEWIYRGRMFKLIDTPGFDDTSLAEMQVLAEVSTFLEHIYERKVHVNGILYLHPINSPRITGSAVRYLDVFRELCGRQALANVMLVTTFWDIESPKKAQAREEELIEHFWQPLILEGSKVLRHDRRTKSTAKATVTATIDAVLQTQVTVLDIQKQLVDEGRKLSQTSAGKMTLDTGLQQQQALEAERGEIERFIASDQSDSDYPKRVMSEEAARMRSQTDRLKNKMSSFDSNFLSAVDKLRHETRILAERLQIPETAALWMLYGTIDQHRPQVLGKPLLSEPLLSGSPAEASKNESTVE